MGLIQNFLLDIRTQRKWYHKALYQTAVRMRQARLPFPRPIGAVLFNGRNASIVAWRRLKQFFFYEPMLRYRCKKVGRGVYFEVNFPLILGYGSIILGDRVRIGGNANLMVSYKVNPDPTIIVGDEVYLGYESTLSCAERIEIGNRVLLAEGATIFDNNNHPLDPQARADNLPVEKEQVAPVRIEDDAWIGAHAIILKGVTVGRGAVVATGAVVTKDVPPRTVVAGNPARMVKQIPE